MSKQDRQGVRTATDLERKYGFGQSFAEVFDLANDAKNTAEEAKNAANNLDNSLTAEEIFLRLTGGGTEHGIYRGSDGNIYINANYIMSGTLKGENLKVDAATIYGKLLASQADISDLNVNAAKVAGTLTGNKIESGTIESSSIVLTTPLDDFSNTIGSAIHIAPEELEYPIGNIFYHKNDNPGEGESMYNLWITTQSGDIVQNKVGGALKISSGFRLSLEAKTGIWIDGGSGFATNFTGNVNFSGATVNFGDNAPVAVFG